jgi:hypothetical protein
MTNMKLIGVLLTLSVFGCGAPGEEPLGTEQLPLPVTASAPCIRVTCDQATCNGRLTISQTVPVVTGNVETWSVIHVNAAQTEAENLLPSTVLTQSPGSVTTVTPMTGFRMNDYVCVLTSVVVRNAAGNVIGAQSAPVVSDGGGGFRLSLQPSSVTATVAP